MEDNFSNIVREFVDFDNQPYVEKKDTINLEDFFNSCCMDMNDKKEDKANSEDIHTEIVNTNKGTTIIVDVAGIAKEDLIVSIEKVANEIETPVLKVKGCTKDRIIGITRHIDCEFGLNPMELNLYEDIKAEIVNGYLYVTIPYRRIEIKDRVIPIIK